MKVQRLRFQYRLGPEAGSLGQRDLVTAWERALKEAGIPLAYSEGKRPAAQIALAAPLPQGVTSDWELVDVFLSERVNPGAALAAVKPLFPEGVELTAVRELGPAGPSLQSQLRWAEYEVELAAGSVAPEDLMQAVEAFLESETWPAEYRRDVKVRHYDLRPLVLGLRVDEGEPLRLVMRLRAEPEMTGRADQVILALGLAQPQRVHRRRLYVEETQPALIAFRRHGEMEGG